MGGQQSIQLKTSQSRPNSRESLNDDIESNSDGSENEFWLGLNPDEPWNFENSDETMNSTLALDKFVKTLEYEELMNPVPKSKDGETFSIEFKLDLTCKDQMLTTNWDIVQSYFSNGKNSIKY